MYEIRQRIGIAAPQAQVHEAFSTTSLLEGGRSVAYPDETVISSWDH